VLGGESEAAVCHPRISLRLAAGVRATIVEQFISARPGRLICNSVTGVRVEPGAELEQHRIIASNDATTHFARTDIEQAEGSRARVHTVVLGAGLARLDVAVRLAGRDAQHDAHLIAHAPRGRHIDYRALVCHGAPATVSRQVLRAVAARRGRIVQNSKVIVEKDCPGADSTQSCRGMLLAADAEIDTRPQLEIYTDAVKCAHGATTGKLDANMLFYLLSRGIERKAAEALLVSAFLADALSGIGCDAVRREIESRLAGELPASGQEHVP
jgi:Fe-S cluster assembly protein SufD